MKTKILLAVILALTLSLVLSVSIFASEDDPYSRELYDGDTLLCTMTFEEGRMTIESHYTGWWEWSPSNEVVGDFITTYKNLATDIVFTGSFGKIHVNAGGISTFAGAEKLVSVCFPKDARILDYSCEFDVFSGCTNLTTVYFGNEADMTMGVIDFRGIKWDNSDDSTRFLEGMFSGCASITEVILPALNNENNNKPTIYEDTFKDCTKLTKITVPETYKEIRNGAFEGCANLKTLNYAAPVSLITNNTFKGIHNGLIINVSRFEDVTTINNVLAGAGISESKVFARVAPLYSGWVVNGDDGHTEEGNIYCKGTLNTHAKTNIKWEVFNEGTAEAPSYTLYFSIDDDGYAAAFPEGEYYGNTILYGYILFGGGNSFVHACGYGGSDGGDKHPWVADTGLDLMDFKKIVVGDGITECNGGTFSCMKGVTTLEMPTSLAVFNGVVLKGCESLSTVYTRGQTPAEGVFNLSNIKNITTTNYSFCACKAVERYIFAEDAKMSELSPQIFLYNTSLKEITIPEGVYRANASAFGGCSALEEVTLPASLNGPLHAKSFENCILLKKITIKGNPTIEYDSTATDKAGVTAANNANAFYNCPVLGTINAPIGSKAQQFAVEFGFESSHVAELYNNEGVLLCTMTYYTKDRKMTIVSHTPGSLFWEWTPMNETVKAFVDAYMGITEHVVFTGNFGKIHTRSRTYPYDSVFMNAENLISVCFPKSARVLDYSKQGGAFAGCTALTTIYFGNEADMKKNMGVIDFSGMRCDKDDFPTTFLKSMFSGCTGITEVILPALNSGLATDGTDNNPTIYADTFAGCTKLVSITVPETYETIQDGAFDTCVNLKKIVYNAPASLVTSGTFTGVHSNLIIQVQSYDDVTAINKALEEGRVDHSSVVAHYKQGMSITGYQVRITGYNGLRTSFSFYDNAFGNYELVEVGSIAATAENYAKYAESFGEDDSILKLVDGEFVTPADNVVKTAVYSGGKFVNNYVETETGFNFSVTVTNFKDKSQYKAEVINCGYEIWLTDGTYYVVFTREQAEGYETNSLYKMTFGMLNDGWITLEKGNNPVYNTLMDCDYEPFSPTTDVEGYLFEDPLDSTKRIAVYLTGSSSPITLTESGLGTAVSNVSHMVFGKNVVLSLPEIDDYWVEHINEQLATLPEGRSFIAITDTHYQSGGYGNAGKSADLMQYVRQMTGIEKVINLGDPFHQEDSYEGAKEQLSRSMEEKFFNYFGDDGIYAIGNHDSNITIARTIDDDDPGTYKMDILLSDKDIYDRTFAHIEEGGKEEGYIIYDEKLLSIIEANESEVKEFVLENVAPEDAASYNHMFGTVNYTAKVMYENLVCWAKMHYAYYDHDSKICYIVLNTGGLTVTDFATLDRELWKFHPSQYEFLYTMLKDIAENHSDYDVVVAGHMFYDCDTAENNYNQNLFKMLSAFEGGTSVSFSASGNNALSGKLFGCTDGYTSRTLSYDFTENDFTGEVFCITGHRHLDLHLVSQTKDEQYYMSVAYDTVADNLSDNAVQLILLNQDNYAESKSSAEGDNVQTMTKGTITEHSFTIFTITDNNTLVATRIGANSGWLQKEFKLG